MKKAGKGIRGIRDKETFKAAVCDWSARLMVEPAQVRMHKLGNSLRGAAWGFMFYAEMCKLQ